MIARCSPVPLEVPDRRYSNLACLGKRILGPVEKPTCSSTLGRNKRCSDHVKRNEFELDVRKRNGHDCNRQHIRQKYASYNVAKVSLTISSVVWRRGSQPSGAPRNRLGFFNIRIAECAGVSRLPHRTWESGASAARSLSCLHKISARRRIATDYAQRALKTRQLLSADFFPDQPEILAVAACELLKLLAQARAFDSRSKSTRGSPYPTVQSLQARSDANSRSVSNSDMRLARLKELGPRVGGHRSASAVRVSPLLIQNLFRLSINGIDASLGRR
jgi:hypothetical protein